MGSAAYPVAATAALSADTGVDAATSTAAVVAAKFTRAPVTPGTASNADSTVETHEAHVMPSTARWIVCDPEVDTACRSTGAAVTSAGSSAAPYRSGSAANAFR
jgi:hypothetical protein